MGPKFGAQKGNKLGSQLGPMSITKLSPNWAGQMGPIHFPKFLLSGKPQWAKNGRPNGVETQLDLVDPKTVHAQSALEFCPIHCPNGRLGQDLGFGGIAFALKLPELLNRNLPTVRAKLGQTSCFPNGPQIWCPIRQ